ncbi:MAG: hypothetical protein ACJAZO_005090 [Myxococcota bacterium]|jgi:hypothetical protein
MRSLFLVGMSLLAVACGDIIDPTLEEVSIELDGTIVQSIDITLSGNNVISEPVDPDSVIVLRYNEPIDNATAQDHIFIENTAGEAIDATIALQLTDVVITPTASMTSENHTIRVESGIDDASGNTTETAVDITFFVSAE